MKTTVSIFTVLILLISSFPIYIFSQDNHLSAQMQLRPRAEYRNGALIPRSSGDEAAAFITNRTRLTLNYHSPGLRMGVSVQNAGVWGQEPPVSRNANLGIYEAWAQLSTDKGFFLKAGRQVLSYDDERLLGALDWNSAGRSHDLLKTGFENKQHKLHLSLAFNQNTENITGGTFYITAQPYKTMQTLWYQFSANKNFVPSFLVMNLGFENGNSITGISELVFLQTYGTYLVTKPTEELTITASAYMQGGKTRSNESIAAWLLAIRSSYHINKKINLVIGTEVLSGEETTGNNTTYNAFNPLYGTHHKFYGAMDYFYASSFTGNLNPGLWDSYAGITYSLPMNIALSANYHFFAMQANLADGGSQTILKKGLGSEIDLQLDWNIRKDVRLSCGYSAFFGTSSMDWVKGGDHSNWQDWGWISLNFSPSVLKVSF